MLHAHGTDGVEMQPLPEPTQGTSASDSQTAPSSSTIPVDNLLSSETPVSPLPEGAYVLTPPQSQEIDLLDTIKAPAQTVGSVASSQNIGSRQAQIIRRRQFLHRHHYSRRLQRKLQRTFIRSSLKRKRQASKLATVNYILLGILCLGIVLPLVLSGGYVLQASITLGTLGTDTVNGVNHLRTVKDLLSSPPKGSGTSKKLLDPNKLAQAKIELTAAQHDFEQVQTILNTTPWLESAPQSAPQLTPYFRSVHAASQIGLDIISIGQEAVNTGILLAPQMQGSLLSNSKAPLITAPQFKQIELAFNRILPKLESIQTQSKQLSLDLLPMSPDLRKQVTSGLQILSQVVTTAKKHPDLVSSLGWLLGVDQPRNFLVQTMDRGELRATGGFTGQYGELSIHNGRVAPFSLQNIALLEYSANSPTYGNVAPAAYRSWWPFANWGLRDANLSADFPTSANLEMDRYKAEVNKSVDGVILFTPITIQHVLRATGPITISRYQETVTAQNLEDKLHYYQLSHPGIAKEKRIEHLNDDESARKMFTSALAHTLIDHIRQAPLKELLGITQQMLADMQTRDLQVYFTNPTLENVLKQNNLAGEMDRSPNRDGLYIDQSNVSVSKASQYVQTAFTENVQLDSKGGATHNLTMYFNYQQTGPVYGFDTYRDYLRFYVPTNAKFLSGSGFDTGDPLCGGVLGDCPKTNVYPHKELVCPPGQYIAGFASPMLYDQFVGEDHPLDKVGGPDNFQSDIPQRGMIGGYILIPKNCVATVKLSWYVPAHSTQTYQYYVQRQAGTNPDYRLTIQPAACKGQTPPEAVHYRTDMSKDVLFSQKIDACSSSTGGR
ncbi:DUF4012 domain-containing protein [Dictyobacter aurantiacus]|uniref:DUF4012 domain-containing protein n=1 Tax=Dictyobacter aurantiacus TaxID=1936993 RepID=A0A401ZFJ4_9CHLR|nr:DUF4012 domain-containing protein [Dictyobacter aurantiacus]GCE05660.1 hypothetical protein KDAU_29890 [Dictyobacter aurantiacus]